MSLGGFMIHAVWMAIEIHAFFPSQIAGLFCRQWQSEALNKTSPRDAGLVINGGEGGIRTLDTLLTYTPLAGERLQPLGHFSGSSYQKPASSTCRRFSGHPALSLPAKTSFCGGAMLPHLFRLLGESLTPSGGGRHPPGRYPSTPPEAATPGHCDAQPAANILVQARRRQGNRQNSRH